MPKKFQHVPGSLAPVSFAKQWRLQVYPREKENRKYSTIPGNEAQQ